MQIDVVEVGPISVLCNLYTGDRCVRIIMTDADYKNLIRDSFFIRDGKSSDSAGVLNTTKDYRPIQYIEGRVKLVD